MAEVDGSANTLNPCAFHLQKLGLELKCPACWKLLDKPTLLPCDHIFCCSCVQKSSQFSTQCPTCHLNYIDQDMKPFPYLENIVTIYKSLDAAFSSAILPILSTKSGTPATISTPLEQKRKRQCGVTSNVKCEQATNFLDNHVSSISNCPVSKQLGVSHAPVASPGSFPSPAEAEHYTNDKDVETENHKVENSVDNSIGIAVDGVKDADQLHTRRSKRQKQLNFGSSKAVLQTHGCNQKIVPDSEQVAASKCNDKCVLKKGTPLVSSAAPCHASDVDRSVCAFCHSANTTERTGPVEHYVYGKPVKRGDIDFPSAIAIHIVCLLWTPRVCCTDGVFQNLESELKRASRLKCSACGLKRAALGCYVKSCRKTYHVPCAMATPDCRWDDKEYLMLCPIHKSSKFPSEKEHPSSTISAPPQSKFGETSPNGPLVFCISALAPNEKVLVINFAAKCGSTVFKFWNPNVTHVFASTDSEGACERTKEVLMAILNGRWILTTDWIKACLEANIFVDEEPYEINLDDHGSRNGPKTGRYMISKKAPKLFDGSSFYFHGNFTNRSNLLDLVIAGGGTIVQSVEELVAQSHSSQLISKRYIVYNGGFARGCVGSKATADVKRLAGAQDVAKGTDAQPIPHTWILGSIAGCKVMPCDVDLFG